MNISTKTLFQYLSEYAEEQPDKRFLWDDSVSYSSREAFREVAQLACAFHAAGVQAGDLLAFRMTRTVPAVLRFLALQALGAVTLMTDPHQSVEDFLAGTGLSFPLRFTLSEEEQEGEWILRDAGGRPVPAPSASGAVSFPDDAKAPALILFTSGTTGPKKAVVLSQYNLVNDLTMTAERGWYLPEDIALGILPFFHIFGLVLLTGALVLRYGLVLPEEMDIPHLLSCIEQNKVTRMNGVPSLYLALARQAEGWDLASLRTGFIGAGPCTQAQLKEIEEKLGITLLPAYGMSECVAITCADYRDPAAVRLAGAGSFYPETRWRIRRTDGTDAAPGETGEILAASPTLMLGYYREQEPEPSAGKEKPESSDFQEEPVLKSQRTVSESAESSSLSIDPGTDEDGLLPTGDLGYLDEQGMLHLTGRVKDIIIRNGNNLSARHIEEAILSFPEAGGAAIIALPDDTAGEVPGAMVQLPEERLPQLILHLKDRLTKPELPAFLRCVDAIPHTVSGKPDKQRIREELVRLYREKGAGQK